MNSKILSFIIVSAAIILVACNRTPDDVLDQEDMAQLMADIHQGESVVESNSSAFYNDSLKRAFRQSIYARHGLTPEQAEKSLRWYGYHMEKYIDVYDRVIEILNDRMSQAQEEAGEAGKKLNDQTFGVLALEGDSVDIWNDIRFRPFNSTMPDNLIAFNYMGEPNWEKGDIYYFRSKLSGNSQPACLTVAIDYSDGTSETFSDRMIGDGWHELKFGLDTVKTARAIYGTIYYNAPEGETAYIDSISMTRTRWISGKPTPRAAISSLRRKPTSSAFD
ncbi:MAG: DUF4296 domain-containing protein [Bacteroides sp.]|nr:DUF4296 domain-containing protein [Bacteroides sp.]MCM1414244.1 DUF4296 domain-containing protein [Bacteroides sp.]MCM1471257.1 DUF4296 domain-containing protein [Bacteroides sp.]